MSYSFAGNRIGDVIVGMLASSVVDRGVQALVRSNQKLLFIGKYLRPVYFLYFYVPCHFIIRSY